MGSEMSKDVDRQQPRRNSFQKLDPRLRARLAHGVDFNLKILVRGARGSGKTRLLLRLQGKNPPAELQKYQPTPEIQVVHAHWRNSFSNDTVKVEAWDVVDEALSEEDNGFLRAEQLDPDAPAGLPLRMSRRCLLDSSLIDIHRGADGVIILHDARSQDSWAFARKILEETPEPLPVLILRNFFDAPDAIHNDGTYEVIAQSQLETARCFLRQIDCNLTGTRGLKEVFSFIAIPFLLKRKMYFESKLRECEDWLQELQDFNMEALNPPERGLQMHELCKEDSLHNNHDDFKVELEGGELDEFFADVVENSDDEHDTSSRKILRDYTHLK